MYLSIDENIPTQRIEEVSLLSHFYYTSMAQTFYRSIYYYSPNTTISEISNPTTKSFTYWHEEEEEKNKQHQNEKMVKQKMPNVERQNITSLQKMLASIEGLPRSARRAYLVCITDRKVIAQLSQEDRSDRERELCKLRQSRYRRRRKLHKT